MIGQRHNGQSGGGDFLKHFWQRQTWPQGFKAINIGLSRQITHISSVGNFLVVLARWAEAFFSALFSNNFCCCFLFSSSIFCMIGSNCFWCICSISVFNSSLCWFWMSSKACFCLLNSISLILAQKSCFFRNSAIFWRMSFSCR